MPSNRQRIEYGNSAVQTILGGRYKVTSYEDAREAARLDLQDAARTSNKFRSGLLGADARQIIRDSSTSGQTMDSATRKSMRAHYYREERRAKGLAAG